MNYNKDKFLNILNKLKESFGSQNKMAEALGISSSYITKIYDENTKNPPAPEYLKKIADNSKGVTTYEELMEICGYLNFKAFSNGFLETKIESKFNTFKKILSNFLNSNQIDEFYTMLKTRVFEADMNVNDVKEIDNFANKYKLSSENKCTLYVLAIDLLEYSTKEISKLINFYNTVNTSTNQEILDKEIKNKTKKIPVVGTVAAGEPILAEQNIIDYEEVPANEFKDGEYFGLKIKGDSMFPRILEGDVVIVRQQNDCDNGKIAVVLINGDEATVKQVKKTDSGLMLIPFNNKYDPIFFTKEEIETKPVKIIGVVKRLIGYNFE